MFSNESLGDMFEDKMAQIKIQQAQRKQDPGNPKMF